MKEDICEPDNALLDAAVAAPPERYPLIPVLTERLRLLSGLMRRPVFV